jgi:transposase-like protein
MANKRRRVKIDGQGDERASSDTNAERLEHLRRIFTKYRREHQSRARIAQSLRDAALEAIQSGIAERDVRRACQISREQLGFWRRRQRVSEQGLGLPQKKARIFPVVDDGREIYDEQAGQRTASDLRLSIGRWEICIRQVES